MSPRFFMQQHHDGFSDMPVLASPEYWDGQTLARLEIRNTPWGYRIIRCSRSTESEALFFQGPEIVEMMMSDSSPCLFTDIGEAARTVLDIMHQAQTATATLTTQVA